MMTWGDFAIRLLLAFILGAAIGSERQWRRTRSVLKTNVLVSLGAAMFVMLSAMIPGDASPTRVAAQVVSGIGFLGGGVILREGTSVRGLNTAATLWCAAAVGSLVGAGLLFQAYFGTLAVVGANLLLRPMVQWFQQLDEQLITHTKAETRYCCRLICLTEEEAAVRAVLLEQTKPGQLVLNELSSKVLSSKNTDSKDIDNFSPVEIKAEYVSDGRNDLLMEEIVMRLRSQVKVTAIKWEIVTEDAD